MRFVAFGPGHVADEPEPRLRKTAGFMQLGYQKQHDVRFPDTAEPSGHLAKLV